MYKRILIPVDGSDPSTQALDAALQLAKEVRAKVRIVNIADVLPPPALDGPTYMDVDEYREAIITSGRAILQRALARAKALRIRPESALIETVGRDVSAAVIDDARRWKADLIMLGTHGRTGLARLFLGSVAEGVVRHAPVAVLLVRARPARGRTQRKATSR